MPPMISIQNVAEENVELNPESEKDAEPVVSHKPADVESPEILIPEVVVTAEAGQANQKKRSRSPKSPKKVSSTALVYQLDTDNSKAASGHTVSRTSSALIALCG